MAASDSPGIDPRYDPAFQRGGAGGTGRAPGAAAGGSAAPRGPQRSQPSTEQPSTEQPTIFIEVPAESDEEVVVSRPPARNPYLLALWIAGVALVLAGALFYLRSALAAYDTTSPEDNGQANAVLINLGFVFAPPLVTVGLGIIAGLLFFSASRWKAREKPSD